MITSTVVSQGRAQAREIVESPEIRAVRISKGMLLTAIGILLMVMAFTANATGKIALSDAFAEVQLPTIEVPGLPVLLLCSLLTLAAGVGFLSGGLSKNPRTVAGVIAGISCLTGFMVWAAASSSIAFTLTSQLNLTLEYSTPLIFGVLAGVLSERAGVHHAVLPRRPGGRCHSGDSHGRGAGTVHAEIPGRSRHHRGRREPVGHRPDGLHIPAACCP